MSKEKFKVAVLYTDGSSIDGKNRHGTGSGSGIHGYCYDIAPTEQAKAIFEEVGEKSTECRAVLTAEVPEAFGDIEYIKMPKTQFAQKILSVEYLALTRVECSRPIHGGTSQVGELLAFIEALEQNLFTAETIHIHTDSSYLMDGYTKWLDNWKRKGWTNSSGQVKNKGYWVRIDAIKQRENKGEFKIIWHKIKGHSDRFGNDSADLLAGKASGKAINMIMDDVSKEEFVPEWDIGPYLVTDETSIYETKEEKRQKSKKSKSKSKTPTNPNKPKKVKDEEKYIPKLLRLKYHYMMSNGEESVVKIGDDEMYRYFGGDHAKKKDDRLLLGKAQPDTMQVLTFLDEPVPILSDIAKCVSDHMWKDTPMMYRSELVLLMNGNFMNQEKFNRRLLDDYDFTTFPFNKAFNEMMFDEKNWISVACRPPLLSYRGMELCEEITGWYQDFIKGDRKSTAKSSVLDITEKLYDGNKMTEWYRRIDKSIRIDMPIPGDEARTVDLILTRNISLPDRNHFNKLIKDNPRVYIVTRKLSNNGFRFFLVLETDIGHQVYCSYHSSLRIHE